VVSWTAGGNGTITPAGGVFTAATVPFTTQVTITATSTQDTTKSGSTVITVATAGTVNSVSATCSPTTIQGGQLTACTATVNGSGNFSPNVTWTASSGTINPITGVYSNTTPGTYSVTATSQQDPTKTSSVPVTVLNGVNNSLPIVVDGGPTGLTVPYVNGAFATIDVCLPATSAPVCQTIDHVLVDTGSVGVRLLAKAAGGELDPAIVPLPQQTSNGAVIAQCNQFVDGFTWGSVSLATVVMAGEIASSPPNSNASTAGLPVQLIGDPTIPTVPGSCSSTGMGIDEGNLQALGANGILGVGNFEQDCGAGCTSGSNTLYYACASGSCAATTVGLPQQITNPAWVLPNDNNGVLVQLPSVPSGGTASVSGSLLFGIGTQSNNGLGSATVFDTDANAFFVTIFNGQTNSCSFIDSGSNAYFFPAAGYPGLITCGSPNSSFYCPANLLALSAMNQSAANTNGATGTVNFNVGNANTLFNNNNGQNLAFSELAGPNAPVPNCGSSFDWGLPFFFGKNVFTAIEQQPVSGTTFVGPFWAY
jgi:hypothetical protein